MSQKFIILLKIGSKEIACNFYIPFLTHFYEMVVPWSILDNLGTNVLLLIY